MNRREFLIDCAVGGAAVMAAPRSGAGTNPRKEPGMAYSIDASSWKWTLTGWRPFQWLACSSPATGCLDGGDVPPVPAHVPGSVQQALLDAGLIRDWNNGIDSRDCEWVEHRHWQYRAVLPAGLAKPGDAVVLDAPGLDYSGWGYCNGIEIGRFEGALLPHRFDLTKAFATRSECTLDIIFEEPPREHGSCGFTSRSRFFKPRYNYGWDWCPRFVPIGIWDRLTLLTGADALVRLEDVRATLAQDNAHGVVTATVACEADLSRYRVADIDLTVLDGDRVVASRRVAAAPGSQTLSLDGLSVEPWWPNGAGPSKCYELRMTLSDAAGVELVRRACTIGFKRVVWRPCEGASADAEPWLCEVNGQRVFLQGVNWTPARLAYPDATPEEYQRLVGLYREMGCNCLRVWGGGILETSAFYDACDRVGILVWQEFPLSSSSIDNWPPEDADAIASLAAIARSYIERRGHHASLLLWSGGNELQGARDGSKVGQGRPVTYDHPCIAMLAEVVRERDPGRRFIASSASGPREYGEENEFGQGVHHDVHGPWGLLPEQTMDGWRQYWERDDALFRSEVGFPCASSAKVIKEHSAGLPAWPPAGPYWKHTSAWWSQWSRYRERLAQLPEDEALAEYVRLTQQDQADALAVAARACKRRFPACGGFLVWMGHDCFPCLANNSLIEVDLTTKPAYASLRAVFTTAV